MVACPGVVCRTREEAYIVETDSMTFQLCYGLLKFLGYDDEWLSLDDSTGHGTVAFYDFVVDGCPVGVAVGPCELYEGLWVEFGRKHKKS
jgi:hypothetical protein